MRKEDFFLKKEAKTFITGRMIKRLVVGAGALLGLAVIAGGAAVWLTLPPSSATLRIAGLSAPVDITVDGYGIPRIHAVTACSANADMPKPRSRNCRPTSAPCSPPTPPA